jgi:hypothetical protein
MSRNASASTGGLQGGGCSGGREAAAEQCMCVGQHSDCEPGYADLWVTGVTGVDGGAVDVQESLSQHGGPAGVCELCV